MYEGEPAAVDVAVHVLLTSDTGYSRGAVFSRLPRAALPPGSLVVAFSPLLDGRFVEALRDMRERGFLRVIAAAAVIAATALVLPA
jgi:hypothetical protein